MRCDQCNKFVSFDEQDPEILDDAPELSADGTVEIAVRIVNACADCGQELKEANFDLSADFDADVITRHQGEGHNLRVDVEAERATDTYPKPKQVKDRKTGRMKTVYPAARYTRTLYGFAGSATLSCTCTDDALQTVEISDFIEGSGMDELI